MKSPKHRTRTGLSTVEITISTLDSLHISDILFCIGDTDSTSKNMHPSQISFLPLRALWLSFATGPCHVVLLFDVIIGRIYHFPSHGIHPPQ